MKRWMGCCLALAAAVSIHGCKPAQMNTPTETTPTAVDSQPAPAATEIPAESPTTEAPTTEAKPSDVKPADGEPTPTSPGDVPDPLGGGVEIK